MQRCRGCGTKFLLDKGAEVHIQGGHYGTTLQAAAYHGHVELVNMLLDAKADIRIPGLVQDAFRAAIEGGRENYVRVLANAGLQGLLADSIGFGLSKLFARQYKFSERPPRNILRDSSPSRKSRYAARHAWEMTQHNSLSDHEHGKGGWTNGTNMELDPFDPRMLLVLTRSDLDVVD